MGFVAATMAMVLSGTGPAMQCGSQDEEATQLLEEFLPACPGYTIFVRELVDDSIWLDEAMRLCYEARRPCTVDLGNQTYFVQDGIRISDPADLKPLVINGVIWADRFHPSGAESVTGGKIRFGRGGP